MGPRTEYGAWRLASFDRAVHPARFRGDLDGSMALLLYGCQGGHGLVRKYGINMKRQVFRLKANEMGWVKYN